jgi:hypothetical protein
LRQVEQDLVICRALCDLFNAPALAGKIAFRGGTAINKLLFRQSLRYSDAIEAFGRVWSELVTRIKGDAWKQTDKVIEEIRQKKYPDLLK